MRYDLACKILLPMFAPVWISSAFAAASPASPCPNTLRIEKVVHFRDFAIRTYRNDFFEGCVSISRGKKLVFSLVTDGRVSVGNDINEDITGNEVRHPPHIPVGTDITGLGKPNLILNVWTGGAHCCFEFHVIELGDVVREVATVDSEDSDYAHFEGIHHNGTYEFLGWDYTFGYWHTSFADSPSPQVILRFNGARYALDLAAMHKAAPSGAELNGVVREVRSGDRFQNYPPPVLWKTMLDLIYTGHPDRAWKLVDQSWQPGHVAKQTFLERFCGRLASGQYFSDLRPLLGEAPCKFDPKLWKEN